MSAAVGPVAVPPAQHKQRQGSSNHQVISDMLDRGINPASVALLNKLLQLSAKPDHVHKLFCSGVDCILNALVRWIARAPVSLVQPASLHPAGGGSGNGGTGGNGGGGELGWAWAQCSAAGECPPALKATAPCSAGSHCC